MRKVFFKTLEDIAKEDKSIFLLAADLGVKFFQNFKDIDPKRAINVGVAEQNMIGVAAGLAMSGKNVYCYSIIPFLTMRAFEQVRVDLCGHNLNVKLLGAGGGLVYGLEGMTHHALEDIAIMRSLPNMTVTAPGDAKEAEALAIASVNFSGPLYVRFGRDIDPVVHKNNPEFKIGKGIVINEGKDICLIATGSMLYPAATVQEILKEKGFAPGLVSMHTIKPIDEELTKDCAKKYQAIFTLEEHSVIGGLGSAVAEVLAESNYGKTFKRIGIADRYTFPIIGSPDYLKERAGLSPGKIVETILKDLNRR
ncbi:MAG: transketolase C-terminal domain-containing protein [bacterium]